MLNIVIQNGERKRTIKLSPLVGFSPLNRSIELKQCIAAILVMNLVPLVMNVPMVACEPLHRKFKNRHLEKV